MLQLLTCSPSSLSALRLTLLNPATPLSCTHSLIVGTLPDGETLPTTRRQDVGLAMLTLAPALAVALALPGSGAESIFAMTGATAGAQGGA